MGTWLLNLPVLAMAGVILVATWLVAAVIYLAVTGLATGEQARAFKASSRRPVILLAAHSGPFTGQIPVKPTVLQQVMPEVTATQPSG